MARSPTASQQAGYTTASDRRHRRDHRFVADVREESIYGLLASTPRRARASNRRHETLKIRVLDSSRDVHRIRTKSVVPLKQHAAIAVNVAVSAEIPRRPAPEKRYEVAHGRLSQWHVVAVWFRPDNSHSHLHRRFDRNSFKVLRDMRFAGSFEIYVRPDGGQQRQGPEESLDIFRRAYLPRLGFGQTNAATVLLWHSPEQPGEDIHSLSG